MLEYILSENPVGVGAVVDGEGLVVLNRTMEELFGYTAQEINQLGGPAALVVEPGDLEEIQQALARGHGYEGVIAFRNRAGETVWHRVKTLPLGVQQGVDGGSVSWHVDVTDAQKLVEQLDRSEERFDEVMNLIPEAVTIRRGGALEFANRAVEHVFGHSVDEFCTIERPVAEWALPEEKHKVRALYGALEHKTSAPVISRQFRIRTAAGDVRWIWSRVFPLGGHPPRALSLSADITDTVEVADRLREKTRDADQANRAKSAFLANLSHEIRTPVAGILGLLDLMENEPEETQRTYRELMRDAAGSLVRMLEDVLDLSRIEQNRLSIVPTETDVRQALHSVVALMRPRATERNVTLEFVSADSVPVICSVDRVRLQQLASNLVSNAVKYTEEGTIRVHLSYLEPHAAGAGRIVLVVEDTGAGMTEGQLSLAFEPFRRLNEGYTQTIEGTGLGLPLVKSLVDLMGGTLDVSSRLGDGTTFTVSIPAPAAESREAASDSPGSAVETSPTSTERQDRTVLLAEDNRIVQLTVQTQLARAGCQVYLAGNGQEAVDIALRHRVDLIYMDIQMPVLSGLDAIRRIRTQEAPADRVPIVAMTAYASRDDQEIFYEAGVNDILTKPCSAADLLHALEKHARDKQEES